MVATHNTVMNLSRLQAWYKTLGNEEIVNAPTYVLLPGMETIAPPAVAICCIGIEVTESINETTTRRR